MKKKSKGSLPPDLRDAEREMPVTKIYPAGPKTSQITINEETTARFSTGDSGLWSLNPKKEAEEFFEWLNRPVPATIQKNIAKPKKKAAKKKAAPKQKDVLGSLI